QVANLALDGAADWILIVQLLPRILLKLLESERDATLRWINIQHNGFDFIARLHDLGRMLHPLRPCHLAHMDETFNALFQFNEGAVVGDAQNASTNVRADRIALSSIEPRIRGQLFESEGHALLVLIKLKNLYVNFVANVH